MKNDKKEPIVNNQQIWADVEELILTSQLLGFMPLTKEQLLTELNNRYIISER